MRSYRALLALSGASIEVAEASSVPADDLWLSEAERSTLGALAVPKRRADWRLGRWAGKGAVLAALGRPDLSRAWIEILATEGGAPAVRFLPAGGWPHVSLSLSHAGGMGFAAALAGSVPVGCDVEVLAPRSEAFVTDYFTETEAAWVREVPRERDVRANLLWSAKESALKALGEGLRLDTRTVQVEGMAPPAEGSWTPVRVTHRDGRLQGWWRRTTGHVWSLVVGRERPR